VISLDKINNPEISISYPDLTNAERQAVPFSNEMAKEQAGFAYRAIHTKPGISK
jgi:hypothetical protein